MTKNALPPPETQGNPEIACSTVVDGVRLNYHDMGTGPAVLLLHGSGPGVSAWANWRSIFPGLEAAGFRVVAPDIPGFGYSDPLHEFSIDRWVHLLLGLLDELGEQRVSLVGNSFGGALALHLAVVAPERIRRAVTMGTGGVAFELTPGLDAVWGYEPTVENMRKLLDIFAHDRSLVTDELAELRYRASVRPGVHEAYSALFPAPRQRWVEAMTLSDEQLATIDVPFLLTHGWNDQVVPAETTLSLLSKLSNSRAHLFGACGHWVQIEKNAEFVELLVRWLGPADGQRA